MVLISPALLADDPNAIAVKLRPVGRQLGSGGLGAQPSGPDFVEGGGALCEREWRPRFFGESQPRILGSRWRAQVTDANGGAVVMECAARVFSPHG